MGGIKFCSQCFMRPVTLGINEKLFGTNFHYRRLRVYMLPILNIPYIFSILLIVSKVFSQYFFLLREKTGMRGKYNATTFGTINTQQSIDLPDYLWDSVILYKITINLSQLILDFVVKIELTSQVMSFRPAGGILNLSLF